MSGLSDAERDACDVAQALAGLAALLRRPVREGVSEADDPAAEAYRLLLGMADDAGLAAARVLAYLREQRGAGDGDLVAVPPRLGQWREWVPPRGHLWKLPATAPRPANEVPQPRRGDPGE